MPPTRGGRLVAPERVVEGLLAGLTYKQIARRLGVAHGTVHGNVQKIYREQGVHSRGELKRKIERSATGEQRSA